MYRGEQIGQVSVTTPLTSFTETFLYRPNGSPLELVYKTAGQASKRYWYVLDGHNNVMGLVDGSGTLVNVYTYDVWGRPDLTTPGATREAVPQPLRYQGYWYDGWDNSGDSGGASWNSGPMPWYWLQVRSYDPSLRRFLQPDPLTGGGLPSYAYANDDPLDVHDPTGQAGVPAACGQRSFVDKGSNATNCVQAAVQEQQSQRREQALWAVPNTLLLSPLRAATGANSSLGERALGVLALLPVVGWAGRGLGLAADVARGLSAASDVAETMATGGQTVEDTAQVATLANVSTEVGSEAASAAAQHGPLDVALSTMEDLNEFSIHVGAENWTSWFGFNKPWRLFPARFEEILNGAERIHFNLSGKGDVPLHQSARFAETVQLEDAGINSFGQVPITTWELYQVSRNEAWLAKTTFYQRTGFNQWDVVPNPFAATP